MKSEPIPFVEDQARRTWASSRFYSLIRRLLQLIGVSKAIEVIYIVEYPTADWPSAHCTGDPICIWSYRGATFDCIPALPELDYNNAIASRTPVIRFCVDGDRKRMILNAWNGYRAGHGSLYQRDGATWKAQGPSWKS